MAGIIVGVDGSESAAIAPRWAYEEARIRDTSFTAVLAWAYLNQYPGNSTASFRPDYHEANALAALEAIVAASLEPDAARHVER